MSTATVTLIAAIVATVVGVGTFFHMFLLASRWPRASGRVVGNVTMRRSGHSVGYDYFPRIEFRAADGKTYEVRGDIGRAEAWPLGQAVALRYRAANPTHTTTMNAWQRLLFSAVFIGFAIAAWYAWLGMPPE
jgi:hypothetical protein